MKALWTKALLVALPLSAVLMAAPPADAHSRHRHHWRGDRSCDYDRGWRGRSRYDDSYYARRGWYDRRPYYGNDYYYSSRYPSRPYADRYYGGYPWWMYFSR